MGTDQLSFDVTGLDVDIVETVPIVWQGREMDSGPIHVGLGDPRSTGVIDYDAGTVRVEFHARISFPELAELLADIGADPAVYAPIETVIRSGGSVFDDHSLRLAGVGTMDPHRVLATEEGRFAIRAPSQCKPELSAGSGPEIRKLLAEGHPVSWHFNPQEKRVSMTLPAGLGGATHELSLSGSYTLTISGS